MKEIRNIKIGNKTRLYRHNLNQKNEVILFTLKRTGYLEMAKDYRLEREDYNSYCLSVTTSGKGLFTFNDKMYEVTPGAILFFDQNKHHVLQNKQEEIWSHYNIYFWGGQAQDFYEMFTRHFGNITTKISGEFIIEKIKELHEQFTSKSYNEVQVSKTIYDMLLFLYQQCQESILNKKDVPALEAKMFINEHFKEDITLDDIANHINISKYYLSHIYKEVWGTSLIKDLIKIRFEQCLNDLKETNLTIEQIMEQNHMTNKHLFIKMCKNETNLTPSELRKLFKNK